MRPPDVKGVVRCGPHNDLARTRDDVHTHGPAWKRLVKKRFRPQIDLRLKGIGPAPLQGAAINLLDAAGVQSKRETAPAAAKHGPLVTSARGESKEVQKI